MENKSEEVGQQNAQTKAKKEKENKKERALRTKQLELVEAVIGNQEEAAREIQKKNKQSKALLSHLRAFYSEMSNIAKGKGMSLLPVAELMVSQINDAIADAKKLIEGDVYLDRVKPFISAGNPPSYPEVLLVTKTVEEVLVRRRSDFDEMLKAVQAKQNEAATVRAGLECAIENIEYAVSLDDVEERLDGFVADSSWFVTDDQGEETFDLDRLDALDISAYFSKSTEGEDGEGDESEEDENDEDEVDDESEEDENDK